MNTNANTYRFFTNHDEALAYYATLDDALIVERLAGTSVFSLNDYKPAPGQTIAVDFPNRETAREASLALSTQGYEIRQWTAVRYTIMNPALTVPQARTSLAGAITEHADAHPHGDFAIVAEAIAALEKAVREETLAAARQPVSTEGPDNMDA